MIRLFILLSILPVLAAFVVRWWFGLRVIKSFKNRQITYQPDRWQAAMSETDGSDEGEASVTDLAIKLRKTALTDWKTRNPTAAASRLSTLRFGMIAPPLAAIIAILGAAAGRLNISWIFVIFLAVTAFCAVISYLTISQELHAILKIGQRVRSQRAFHRRDDEDDVIRAACALAWDQAAPSILRLIQK